MSLLLTIMLFSGCSIQPTQKQDEKRPNIAQSIQQAELLRKQKQYSESEDPLIQAIKYYPDHPKLQLLLEQIQTERQHHKQLLKDQLLVAELTLIQQQRPLLKQLAKSENDDLVISSQLFQLEKIWLESRLPLSTCGEQQLKRAPDIAEKCLRLALTIKEQKTDRKRLTNIERNKEKATKQRLQRERNRQIQQLLKKARHKQERNELYNALILLDQILELTPESANAINLKADIQKKLDKHTQGLLSAGEALYQRGQLKGAIVVWNTLLLLNPQHKKASQKIKRAQQVLDNLQQLRQQQSSTTHKAE
ncbi:tetratricopeptide repeat protein [Pseudomonadota bacterium]